jgi:histidine triad (HIT) family protein
MMTDCAFCRRIEAEEYDSLLNGIVSFTPLNPVVPGHLLIVPTVHVADARANQLVTGMTFAEAARIARGIDSDFNLITSAGPDATQTVFHLHVHLIPRRAGDGLKLPWTEERS